MKRAQVGMVEMWVKILEIQKIQEPKSSSNTSTDYSERACIAIIVYYIV